MSDEQLMQSIRLRWAPAIRLALAASSIPPAFLAALIANESGGDPAAQRFEPAVFAHLKAVAAGQSRSYGSVTEAAIETEVAGEEARKTSSYHAQALAQVSATCLATWFPGSLPDEMLRDLATSWGLTQIMGYHVLDLPGAPGSFPENLALPAVNLKTAVRLLSQFAERDQLDLGKDFEALFRCWNTGRPDGKTFSPAYVANGLARIESWQAGESA